MGRCVKRVPLDFGWPLNKPWKGYVNPYHRPCPGPDCQRYTGRTPARALAEAAINLILIAGEDAAKGGSLHPWASRIGGETFTRVGFDATELSIGLAGRGPFLPFGHDSVDRYVAVEKLIVAAGLPKTWGYCPVCGGQCIDPAFQERYEAWHPEEPPTGEGWQVWETVSEGSPISPIFKTAEGMIDWLVGEGVSREAAEAFAKSGWVPSMVTVVGKMYEGIESAKLMGEKKGD